MAFECKILADSVAPCGKRLTTFCVTYPRIIHSELLTHKMLSRSSASSRAIPIDKLIQRVIDDPFIPLYIGQAQKGMQAGDELTGEMRDAAVATWLRARDQAVIHAQQMRDIGAPKQVVNRLIEPWMWITVIVSSTELDNFFGLRCHEAAEPHLQHIARMMRDDRAVAPPKVVPQGEWHLPFITDEDRAPACELAHALTGATASTLEEQTRVVLIKVAVGRCARVSYLTHEGQRDLREDVALHDRLMAQSPLHASPAEHIAQALDFPSWYMAAGSHSPDTVTRLQNRVVGRSRTAFRPLPGELEDTEALASLRSGNFTGWKQWRKTFSNENIGGLMP